MADARGGDAQAAGARRLAARLTSLRGALGRVAALLAGTAVLTAAASALLGALAGSELSRAVSLGFYLVGSFLLVIAFFVGNRGPARVVDESDRPVAWFLPVFGSRRMRWATAEEHAETINVSALFMVLGLFLVALGALVDTRHQLV